MRLLLRDIKRAWLTSQFSGTYREESVPETHRSWLPIAITTASKLSFALCSADRNVSMFDDTSPVPKR